MPKNLKKKKPKSESRSKNTNPKHKRQEHRSNKNTKHKPISNKNINTNPIVDLSCQSNTKTQTGLQQEHKHKHKPNRRSLVNQTQKRKHIPKNQQENIYPKSARICDLKPKKTYTHNDPRFENIYPRKHIPTTSLSGQPGGKSPSAM